MSPKSCAFSGNRPQKFPWKYDESDPRCIALRQALDAQIIELVNDGYTDFFSGMAEGIDTWAALTVLALREKNPALKLYCILPCKDQPNEWSEESKKRYYSILKQANSVVYVSEKNQKNCMLKRNRYLAEHADCLLAVYNGEWRSGTAATVRYAQKLERKIIIMNPRTGEMNDKATEKSKKTKE